MGTGTVLLLLLLLLQAWHALALPLLPALHLTAWVVACIVAAVYTA